MIDIVNEYNTYLKNNRSDFNKTLSKIKGQSTLDNIIFLNALDAIGGQELIKSYIDETWDLK